MADVILFDGGPADGRKLEFSRLPSYLRVVTQPTLLDLSAGLDVLDQVEDTPSPAETVSIYRLVERGPSGHMCGRGSGGIGCVSLHAATYRHMPDVDGEQLRENSAWAEWATGRPAVVPGQVTRDALADIA